MQIRIEIYGCCQIIIEEFRFTGSFCKMFQEPSSMEICRWADE